MAVLEKRGKFWAAEPQFQAERSRDGEGHAGASRRLALGSNRVADSAGDAARTGDLVLVRQAGGANRRGGRAQIARVLGRPDVARDLIEGLMLDRGLPRGFEQAVEREDHVRFKEIAQLVLGKVAAANLKSVAPQAVRLYQSAENEKSWSVLREVVAEFSRESESESPRRAA